MHSIDKNSWHFVMLFRFGNILGLNPLRLTNDSAIEPSLFGLLYPLLQTILFGFICVEVFLDRYLITTPGETEVFFILDQQIVVLTFLELSSCWISFGFSQKRLLRIADQFKKTSFIEQRLDIVCDYSKFVRRFAISMSCFNFFFLLSVTYTMWIAFRMTPEQDLKWWCIYNVIRVIHYNMICLFVATITLVTLKFSRLNTQLENLLICDESNGHQFFGILWLFSELHRETCGLLDKIVSYFTIPLLITITSHIIHITANIYCYYLYVEDVCPKNWDVFYVTSILHWITFPIAAIVIISDCCGCVIIE
ncbi:gustatory receptor 9CTE, partial [Diachasma alloeum]